MAATTALTMGFVMSFVMTFLNLGLVDNFIQKWMMAFLGALPIGFPLALLLIPIIKAIIDRFTEPLPGKRGIEQTNVPKAMSVDERGPRVFLSS